MVYVGMMYVFVENSMLYSIVNLLKRDVYKFCTRTE